ncbi:MAG: ATP-binding protein [Pseudolabrys sp.]
MPCRASSDQLLVIRPLLDIPKTRLIATLKAAKIPFAEDPSNRDPRFTRVRVRDLMPGLAEEGLDARRLALLARRLKRADAALDVETGRALHQLARPGAAPRSLVLDPAGYAALPDEIGLRLLARALAPATDGAIGLGKLEALKEALDAAQKAGSARFRRSLAGAMVTLGRGTITVEPAPPRRSKSLTKSGSAGPRGKAPSRKLR